MAATTPAILTEDRLQSLDILELQRAVAAARKLPTAPGKIAAQYQRPTPQRFITEVIGAKPSEAALARGITVPWTPDQNEIMEACASSERDAQHLAIRSGNSVGKTWLMAHVALWFLLSEEDTIVITTAPNARQVEQLLWGEIRQAFERSVTKLPGRILQTQIKIGEKWYAAGYTARTRTGDTTATAFQGVHSRRVVVLIDEATDVHEVVWSAAERITTGPRDKIIAIGNPTDPACKFATVSELRRPDGTPMWRTLTVSGENHPNVLLDDPEIIPGAVTRRFIEDVLHESGSRDSGVYRSAVLGLFPTESPDTLISLPWIIRAQKRYEELEDPAGVDDRRGCAVGLDIAGMGTDLTVLSVMRNGIWMIPKLEGRRAWHQGKDVDEALELLLDAVRQIPNVRAIALDDTGLGAAVTAGWRKRETSKDPKERPPLYLTTDGKARKIWLIPVNFGSSSDLERFSLKKDECWWKVREAFREDKITIPSEQVIAQYEFPRGTNLRAQLAAPIYRNVGEGRIEVYDKRGAHGKAEITKNLPTKSPDVAHSLMLASYAWQQLRADPERARPIATTCKELFEQQTQAAIEKRGDIEKRRRYDKGKTSPLMPWQRRK